MLGDARTMMLSDVVKVTLYWLDGVPTSYMVPKAEVDVFVEASKRLHYKPGKNPHNDEEAAKIWRIGVSEFELRGPFWWTVPDLQRNNDPSGAHIVDGGRERDAFIDHATAINGTLKRPKLKQRKRRLAKTSMTSVEG